MAAPAKKENRSIYGVHPGIAMVLKEKHKLGTNSAWWIAERADGKGSEEDTPKPYLRIAPKCVDEQYFGKKESLWPIYERLLILAASLGSDVRACPGKTIVPLYRQHVFAQIKTTTNTRVDLGLALANYKRKLPKRVVVTSGLTKKEPHPAPDRAANTIRDR